MPECLLDCFQVTRIHQYLTNTSELNIEPWERWVTLSSTAQAFPCQLTQNEWSKQGLYLQNPTREWWDRGGNGGIRPGALRLRQTPLPNQRNEVSRV